MEWLEGVGNNLSLSPLKLVNYQRYKKDLKIQESKKPTSIKELESKRLRYYEEVTPASTAGEMVGSRGVTEYNPKTGATRYWRETVDKDNNIRIVRPQSNTGAKVHYYFDKNSAYKGSDKWL